MEDQERERDQCGQCGAWYDVTYDSMKGVCPLHEWEVRAGAALVSEGYW